MLIVGSTWLGNRFLDSVDKAKSLHAWDSDNENDLLSRDPYRMST